MVPCPVNRSQLSTPVSYLTLLEGPEHAGEVRQGQQGQVYRSVQNWLWLNSSPPTPPPFFPSHSPSYYSRARFTDLHENWLCLPSSHSPFSSTYSFPSFFPFYSPSHSPSYFYSPLPRDWPLRFSEVQRHLYLRHNSSVYCNSPTLSVTRECVVSSQTDIHSLPPATHFQPHLSLL